MKSVIALLLIFSSHFVMAEKVQLYTEHLPPFQMVNEQKQVVGGIAHVVVKELMDRLHLQASYIPLPWARAYLLTQEQKNALIYSIARSPKRENKFQWIGKIKQVRYFFYGATGDEENINLADRKIRSLNVVVVRGSIEYDLLSQIGFEDNKNLFIADSYIAAFRMAQIGRVDAVYSSEFSYIAIARTLGLDKNVLHPIYTLNQSLDMYVAANKDSDPEFIKAMQEAFDIMVRDGTVKQLIIDEEIRLFDTHI